MKQPQKPKPKHYANTSMKSGSAKVAKVLARKGLDNNPNPGVIRLGSYWLGKNSRTSEFIGMKAAHHLGCKLPSAVKMTAATPNRDR